MSRRSPTRPQLRFQLRSPFEHRQANLSGAPPLTPAEISNFAAAAGFSGDDLITAVAIALAESNGYPGAHNTKGEDSRGLWQIYVSVHPEFAGWDLYDPATNARAAYILYSRRGGFQDWTTYTRGRYLAFMDAAQQGVMSDARGDVYYEVGNTPVSAPSVSESEARDFQSGVSVANGSNVPVIIGVAVAAFWGVNKLFEWMDW